MGCLGNLIKIFLGLIMILIMLVVGYKLIFDPYTPEEKNYNTTTRTEETYQKADERTYKQTDDTEPSIDNVNYDVPLQTGSNHDYIMENTFQKPGVVMELTPQLESGLVYAIKVFKSQFGPDFSPTIISAHDSYHIHDKWSRHRYGQAVDISLADLPLNQRRRVVRILEGTLPKDYKVRWESQYTQNEHIHLQSNR
ncbi:hypothetical protein [Fibrobacter sp.]|uniref:hypothetical protein n=1 Tax=Fibrobacter sp. TaxID=35828 RepID=UPI00388D27E1